MTQWSLHKGEQSAAGVLRLRSILRFASRSSPLFGIRDGRFNLLILLCGHQLTHDHRWARSGFVHYGNGINHSRWDGVLKRCSKCNQ